MSVLQLALIQTRSIVRRLEEVHSNITFDISKFLFNLILGKYASTAGHFKLFELSLVEFRQ